MNTNSLKIKLASLQLLIIVIIYISCAPNIPYPLIAPNSYNYSVDYLVFPTKVDSIISVVINFHNNQVMSEKFQFPSQIPGSYELEDFRNYIRDIKVTDNNGKSAILSKSNRDKSSFDFTEPMKVKKISYNIKHTYKSASDTISTSSGTLFNEDLWHISPHAVFGFLPELINEPIRVKINIPENWKIGTALSLDSLGYYSAKDYHELIASPILCGKLTTRSFMYNNNNFFIYNYSNNPYINAREIEDIIEESVEDVDYFLNGFPVDNYVFLIMNFPRSNNNVKTGALEYPKSSFYSIRGYDMEEVESSLSWISRHELFHVLTPLSIRGEEVHNLDYINPLEVQHLWFYEGLTQWATYKMRLMNNSMTTKEFLRKFKVDLIQSDFKQDTSSLINLSIASLYNKDEFVNIYRRGFLLGTMLDFEIIRKTDGATTLRKVLLKMKELYPKNKPFPSDSLFDIIASLSHPDIKTFCIKYIRENEPLPIKKLCDQFGITYKAKEKHDFIKSEMDFYPVIDKSTKRYVVKGFYNKDGNNPFEEGDTILSIDDENLFYGTPCRALYNIAKADPGRIFSVKIKRKNKVLDVIDKSIPFYTRHTFRQEYEMSWQKQRLFDAWRHESS